MRITRRTSGGRGEYEVSESSLSGLRPVDLQGKQLIVDLGQGIIFPTATTVVIQGGKPRLRLIGRIKSAIHLHRQVSVALMMPHAAREDRVLAGGLPIMRTNQYAIDQLNLSDAISDTQTVRLHISGILLRNFSYHAESLSTTTRISLIRDLWARKLELPPSLSALIASHESHVLANKPIGTEGERVVQQIQEGVTDLSTELGLAFRTASEDALHDLVKALDISIEPPAPPVRVAEIDPNEGVIKRRVMKEWKRWANSRGSTSALFRQAVRQAYRSTCLVCGTHLPTTSINGSPGVDAAHILPWCDFDLDVVSNGICLCKLHHWAFDEGLIGITESNGEYRVVLIPGVRETIASENSIFDMEFLDQSCGIIPGERLPSDRREWPSPRFLRELRESE